jgi:hypothetical protein
MHLSRWDLSTHNLRGSKGAVICKWAFGFQDSAMMQT